VQGLEFWRDKHRVGGQRACLCNKPERTAEDSATSDYEGDGGGGNFQFDGGQDICIECVTFGTSVGGERQPGGLNYPRLSSCSDLRAYLARQPSAW
jgi:hypothetical protein